MLDIAGGIFITLISLRIAGANFSGGGGEFESRASHNSEYRCGTCKVRQFPKLAHSRYACWGKTCGSSPIPRSGGYNDPRDRTDRGCFGRKTEVTQGWFLVCINGKRRQSHPLWATLKYREEIQRERRLCSRRSLSAAPLFERSVSQFPLSSPALILELSNYKIFAPRRFSSI